MAASGYAGHLTPCNRGFPTLRIDECNMTRREYAERYPKCPIQAFSSCFIMNGLNVEMDVYFESGYECLGE